MLWHQFKQAFSNSRYISNNLLHSLQYVILFRSDDISNSMNDYSQTIINDVSNHWITMSCVIYTYLLARHKQLWGCLMRDTFSTIIVWITTTLHSTEVGFGLHLLYGFATYTLVQSSLTNEGSRYVPK
jgi:hypothetical protein